MRLTFAILLVLLIGLQVRLWSGNGGLVGLWRLEDTLAGSATGSRSPWPRSP